jgi:D-3-phosphoglycerate dehydrogenase
VGYVVIDVDTTAPEAALADLASLPDTIRSRLLY